MNLNKKKYNFGYMNIIDNIKKIKNILDCFIAPLIVTSILFIVYAIKGVYPFGLNTIAYYDMASQYIPFYTHFWDAFHGLSDIYLNWYSGLGVSMADIAGMYFYFPLNLFFLFVSRDGILYSLSLFLAIKLFLSAFTMSYYTKRHFGNMTLTICMGIMYAFCGYVVQYYMNLFFLDFVILFPLIVLSLEKLLLENKNNMFIFVMFLTFISFINIAIMVIIYLVLKTCIIIKTLSKENKKKSIRQLFFSIIISLMLSCFVLIPSLLQLLQSTRISEVSNFEYFKSMKLVYNDFRNHKQFIMYGSEIAIGALFLVLIKGKKEIKKYESNIFMIILLGLPIIHEGINLLWHLGSYKHFPIRFGFMFTFECLVFASQYFSDNIDNEIKYISKIAKLLGLAMIPFVAYVLFDFCKQFNDNGISDQSPYGSYRIFFVTLSIVYMIVFVMEKKKARNISLFLFVIIQTFCSCYGFISPLVANDNMYRIQYVKNAITESNYKLEDDLSHRIKANPAEYESNSDIIMRKPSMAAWLYGMSSVVENELLYKMGYDGNQSFVMSTGGTFFTDLLLRADRYISSSNPDPKIYSPIDSNSKIYESKYSFPFGFVLNDAKTIEEKDLFEYNNSLFNCITGLEKKLIDHSAADKRIKNQRELSSKEIETLEKKLSKEKNVALENVDNRDSTKVGENDISDEINEDNKLFEFDVQIPIEDLSSVYIYANSNFSGSIIILLNDEPLPMDSFETLGEFYYPNYIRRGIVTLGTYEDELLSFSVYSNNSDIENIEIGVLNHSVLKEGINAVKKRQSVKVDFSKNDVVISGDINNPGIFYLPIGYSKNWYAWINGNKADIKPCMNDSFIAVDVQKGNINLKFKYIPYGLNIGILISVLGLICLFGLLFIRKRYEKSIIGKVLDTGLLCCYYSVFYIILLVMYIIPICIKLSL